MTTSNGSELLSVLGAAHFANCYNFDGTPYHIIDKMKLHIDFVLSMMNDVSSSAADDEFSKAVEKLVIIRNNVKGYLEREAISCLADLDVIQRSDLLRIASVTWMYGNCGTEVEDAFSKISIVADDINNLPQLTNSEFFRARERETEVM